MGGEIVTANDPKRRERLARQELNDWLSRAPGCHVASAERDALADVLPDLFGYHLVQLGQMPVVDLMHTSRIAHQVVLQIAAPRRGEIDTQSQCGAISDTAALPLAAGSVDVVLLPHVLEFAEYPHTVLREVERILIGEGHVVIIGFNPLSLFGIWRMMLGWRRRAPWAGHYFSGRRLKDWLTLLGFDIVRRKLVYFRPPCRSGELNDRLSFLENLGARFWPFFGSISIIVASKRVVPLTAARMHWRSRARLVAAGITEPSSRTWSDRRDESERRRPRRAKGSADEAGGPLL
ncbi:MAG: methyltransferase domain-containing protein [Gammaproteobacteria bacterium]|nr:methyltransferase domain-containing protein [Gammaproteobacteria bacterium]